MRHEMRAAADHWEFAGKGVIVRVRSILVLADYFLPHRGGSRVYYYMLYQDLVKNRPDRVTVLTKKVPGWEDFDRNHLGTGLRIVRRFHPWPDWRYWQWSKLIADVGSALWWTLCEKIDLIHSGDLFPQGVVSVILKRILGVPFVAYCHGEEVTQIDRRRLQPKMRDMIYKSADAVIAANGFARGLLLRIGVAESRIFKILPGVDMSSFAPAPKDAALIARFGLDGKVVVMSVSRLVERKGHSHVLKALRQVRDSVPEFHYLIVGDGPERKNIEQLVADLGLGRQVTVVGGVSGEDLGKFYNLCDLFVLANRDVEGDVEGFGMVFLEANACGKPVLGGRTGGTSEAVIEGSTGLLVDPEDIDQIASALRLLISDAALRERLGAAGLARVRADFSWDTRTEQLSAVSEFVLGHRN